MHCMKRIADSLIFAARGRARRRHGLVVWLLLGMAAAGLAHVHPRRAEAMREGVTLQGEAAIAQLKREGSYESLAAAYRAAAGGPWSRGTKLAQPDFEKADLFGSATAISGDTAVIGASNGDLELKADRGAAYVFVRYGAVWALQQKLWAPNGAAYDEFGLAVAIGGDTLVVGAPGHNQGAGSAYVFVRSSGVWAMQKELTAPGARARAQFGWSVALSGDTIAVGEENGEAGPTKPGAGRCLVFIRAGTNWMPQATLLASDAQTGDQLGWSVALSGNTLIAGAPGSDTVENPKEPGAAYVFTRTGTVWSQQQKLTAADAGVGDHFGYAVGLSGETAVIGAPWNKIGASDDQGAAYVFTRAGAVWSQQQQLLAADGGAGDLFGLSVAVSGQTAAVGAPGRDGDTGVAFAFVRSGTVWSQQRRFAAVPGQPLDIFGASVSISGETVLASAPLLPRGPASRTIGLLGKEPQARELFGFPSIGPASYGLIHPQGTVGVFTRTGASWTQEARLTGQNAPEIEEFFGSAVAISGDTAVISAPSYRIQVGGVFVFVRRHGFWELQQRLDSPNNQRYDFFGLAVAINGETIAVSAPGVQNSPTNRGAIFVFTRVGDLWSMEQRLTAGDTRPVVYFGQSVALDGDTIAGGDSIVDYRTPRQGAVYVFTRTDGSWSQRRKLTGAINPGNDEFGAAIALRGNTLVVGAPSETIGANPLQGAAYVFTGSGANWTQQARLFRQTGVIGDTFGNSVAVSGETIAIGAFREENGTTNDSGAVHVYVRTGTAWQLQQRLAPPMPRNSGYFGSAVALRGDTIVGGAPGEGAVELFARAGGVWTQQMRLTRPEGAAAEGNVFGASVAINEAGDAMLIGNSSDWVGNMEGAGSAYIFEPPATPPCEFAIAPASATIGPATETGNVTVTASE
ncbi:MAG: FG-GAP repeat protein, partial [Blastocatellia bacterium]|nr:FG-GAP repeat protein [Blastocatellia bacterium]